NEDYDALGIFIEAGIASVTSLIVRDGKLIGDQHFFLQTIEGRGEPEVLSAFLRQHFEGPIYIPREVLVPHELEDADAISEWLSDKAGKKIEVRHPQRGDKVRVLEMAHQN